MERDVARGAPSDVSSDGFAGRLAVLSGLTGRTCRPDELKARIAAESWARGAARWQVCKLRQLVERVALPLLTAERETPAFAAIVVEGLDPKASPPPKTAVAANIVEIMVGDVVIRAPDSAGAEHRARAIRATRLAAE